MAIQLHWFPWSPRYEKRVYSNVRVWVDERLVESFSSQFSSICEKSTRRIEYNIRDHIISSPFFPKQCISNKLYPPPLFESRTFIWKWFSVLWVLRKSSIQQTGLTDDFGWGWGIRFAARYRPFPRLMRGTHLWTSCFRSSLIRKKSTLP